MPSKHMLPKGKRRQTVKHDYRIARDVARAAGLEPGMEPETEPAAAEQPAILPAQEGAAASVEGSVPAKRLVPVLDEEELETGNGVRTFPADASAAGMRLDAYLAKAIPEISRSRVQMMTDAGQVTVNGAAAKASLKLKGGEQISIEGEPRPEPLKAFAEDIPLDIVYEDDDLAVINKPAGMMVHSGAGATDDDRNRGTLVNALLFHFGKLSEVGGDLRPGIVHRLDKMTSGLILVAKNDVTHRRLAEMFSERDLEKTYVALVHGRIAKDTGSIKAPIERDLVRRIRMTTKRPDGRPAVSHWKVLERIHGRFGQFTLAEVKIETGRTHQIRVHLASIGYPVVGDTLYGAPGVIRAGEEQISLDRNFLHAARLEFDHPRTGKRVELEAELAAELTDFVDRLRA